MNLYDQQQQQQQQPRLKSQQGGTYANVMYSHIHTHTHPRASHRVYVVYKSVFAYKNVQCFRWRFSNVINVAISDCVCCREYALIRAQEIARTKEGEGKEDTIG